MICVAPDNDLAAARAVNDGLFHNREIQIALAMLPFRYLWHSLYRHENYPRIPIAG